MRVGHPGHPRLRAEGGGLSMVRERQRRRKLRAARSLGEQRVSVSARTSPRTALLTRVRAQSRRCWFHLLTTARPHPKITAHSPFRPRYACSHLPLEFRSLLAEAGSDANSRTNRLRIRHQLANRLLKLRTRRKQTCSATMPGTRTE